MRQIKLMLSMTVVCSLVSMSLGSNWRGLLDYGLPEKKRRRKIFTSTDYQNASNEEANNPGPPTEQSHELLWSADGMPGGQYVQQSSSGIFQTNRPVAFQSEDLRLPEADPLNQDYSEYEDFLGSLTPIVNVSELQEADEISPIIPLSNTIYSANVGTFLPELPSLHEGTLETFPEFQNNLSHLPQSQYYGQAEASQNHDYSEFPSQDQDYSELLQPMQDISQFEAFPVLESHNQALGIENQGFSGIEAQNQGFSEMQIQNQDFSGIHTQNQGYSPLLAQIQDISQFQDILHNQGNILGMQPQSQYSSGVQPQYQPGGSSRTRFVPHYEGSSSGQTPYPMCAAGSSHGQYSSYPQQLQQYPPNASNLEVNQTIFQSFPDDIAPYPEHMENQPEHASWDIEPWPAGLQDEGLQVQPEEYQTPEAIDTSRGDDPHKASSVQQKKRKHDKKQLQSTNDDGKSKCVLDIQDLPEKHGLIITDYAHSIFQYPLDSEQPSQIVLSSGKWLRVFCPGENSSLNLTTSETTNSAHLYCEGGSLLYDFYFYKPGSGREFLLEEFECTEEPTPVLKRTPAHPQICNATGQTHYEIGYPLVSFRVLIDVCVIQDAEKNFHLFFLRTLLTYKTELVELPESPIEYLTSDAYLPDKGVNLSQFYLGASQSLLHQLGPDQYARLTQGNDQVHYITPGHLIGRGLFLYRSEQKAGFHWATIKPMWSNLQRYWELVDVGIRKLRSSSSMRGRTMTIFSGTWGQQHHDTDYGTRINLFLGRSADGRHVQPIPQLFYKIVFTSKGCIAIVGHNSPYPNEQGTICDTMPKLPKYLRPVEAELAREQKFNVVYACKLCKDFEVIHHLPITEEVINLKQLSST